MVNLRMITDSSFSADYPEKYDVFLSFRGEDTRNNFTSHLHGSLEQKNVKTFIDYDLERGDEISTTLMKAIEESHTSIIIFSENYASSKWCLEELSKIMECKKSMEQDVIPVFYNVDPANVRKQVGSYKKALRKHEKYMIHNMEKVQKWRVALTEAANLAGFTWNSQSDRNEFEFIKDIVEDITKKLNLRYPIELRGLVGIEENYVEIESLLKVRSSVVQIIGIWGMGGIGKTTLATTLYAKLSSSFENACFLENVRENSEKKGPNALREKMFSMLLKEENLNGYFDTTKLKRRKVFIVLDDVATPMQLDGIIDCSWLGLGSKVVVTTRNKHVFRDDDEIYEVKQLNHDDSLELFCANVFSEKYPKTEYEELLEDVIGYCKGLPLALKVLGARFRGTSKEVWESDMRKLKKYPDMEIHKVLRLSYESLDQTQKDIFLDIACFFKVKSMDYVTSLLEACEFYPVSGIQVLLDMALITISSDDTIEMHDRIQEMGQRIVHEQSIKDPGRRSRLWNPKEVYDVLKNDRGTKFIEGIKLDMSQIQKDLILSSDSFAKMSKLRYLEFCDWHKNDNIYIYLPHGLGSLPDELRYLCWPTYCLKSLPSTFCAEMLVELRIPNSNLEKLWDGVQNLGNLKTIELGGSKQLVEVPDLSMAPNLDKVNFSECESLREVHPSIFSLPNLRSLDLNGCKQIESLTTNIHMKSLQTLYLYDCSSLKEFSVTSEEMEDLYLGCTAIHDFPSSFWSNRKLRDLHLGYCVNLKIDWNKLFDDQILGYLTDLSLKGCKQVDASNVGHILDVVPSLTMLDLSYCSNLEALPPNIGLLSSLEYLDLRNCCNLEALHENIGLLSSLEYLDISRSNVKSLPANVKNLSMLKTLYMSDCKKLVFVPELPQSLHMLGLSGSNVESLPANLNNLSILKEIDIDNCMKLVAVPELPPSLIILRAVNCTSLELDTNFTQRLLLQQYISSSSLKHYNKFTFPNDYVMLPRGHVLELFRITSETTSITIPSLPRFHLCAFLLCIVLSNPNSDLKYYKACCHIYKLDEFKCWSYRSLPNGNLISDHVILWHVDIKYIHKIQEGGANDNFNNISFEFDIQDNDRKSTKDVIKGCGVLPVYANDLELKLGGIITKDIVEFQSNVQSSNSQEPLPLANTQMQDEKKLIENDSRDCVIGNQLVAKGKKQLSLLFIIQTLFLLIGVIITYLSGMGKDNLKTIAFSSVIISVISLIIAEIGRR